MKETNMIDYVEKLIDRFRIELNKNDRSGVYAITQRMLAYNSNRIEGSTLTEDQTASLFETGTVLADGEVIKAKDIEEMTGHFSMFNEMLKTFDKPLSHELIKSYHYRLKSGVFEDLANGYAVGEYKNRANRVGNIVTALPEEVFERMDDLINSYNQKEKHTIEDIAQLHAEFEKIHPFQDGNGRTGRILIFKECLKNRIVPLVINDKDKTLYYKAISLAQNENDYSKLIEMFKKEQEIYFQNTKDFVIDFRDLKSVGVDIGLDTNVNNVKAMKEQAKKIVSEKNKVAAIREKGIDR